MPLHCLSLGFHWNSTASRHNRGAALLDRRPATMSSLVAFLLLEDWCVCVSWSTVCVILVCLSAIIWLKCGQLMCRGPGGLTQLHARFAVSRSILTASPPQTPHKPQTWWGTIHTFGTPRLICMMLSVSGGLKGHTSDLLCIAAGGGGAGGGRGASFIFRSSSWNKAPIQAYMDLVLIF